jgi:two-component system, NtrC family, C4-dicarboxylate transport response regulator DctD
MIYLIDNDKSVRRGFEMFLKSAGYDYRSIESSEDFIPQFKPVQGDLIVLDLSLPGLNGNSLLKKFNDSDIQVPIIVVTSMEDFESRELCREYGVKAFLRKPVDGEALIDIIKYNLKQ